MKVQVLHPYGYCYGVIHAIELAKKTKSEHPSEHVSILGMLVHNTYVIHYLEDLGIQTFFDSNRSLEELLNDVPMGYVIFTAHGHDKKLEELAIQKGYQIVDATCPFVQTNLKEMKNVLKQNKNLIYIGKKNHPETVAALSMDPNIYFYDVKEGFIDKIPPKDEPVVILNQTTLSILEMDEIYQNFQKQFTHLEIHDEICNQTRLRQEKVLHLSKNIDLLFVIGDIHSNNTESLYSLAKTTYPHLSIYKISSLNEIQNVWLKNHQHVALVSGASTPKEIVDDIASFLEKYMH